MTNNCTPTFWPPVRNPRGLPLIDCIICAAEPEARLGDEEAVNNARVVPDMQPASRLAGSAFKGLFAKSPPAGTKANATVQSSTPAVTAPLPIDPACNDSWADPLVDASAHPLEPSLQARSAASAPQPRLKPSGRLAGNALRALGSSRTRQTLPVASHAASSVGPAASGPLAPPPSNAAADAGPASPVPADCDAHSHAASRAASDAPSEQAFDDRLQQKARGTTRLSGKLAGSALRALSSETSRCAMTSSGMHMLPHAPHSALLLPACLIVLESAVDVPGEGCIE